MENEQVKPATDTVLAIRNEANSNEIFGAICYDFAHRQRTREAITVRGLQARMEKQGANFKKEEYQKALKFLSSLQLGNLTLNKKGEITGLKNIDVTLQSIGQASALKVTDLDSFKPQRRFKKLQNKPIQALTSHKLVLKPQFQKQYTVNLLIKQGDNPITIPGPMKLSANELGEFLIEFAQMTKRINV